MRFRTHVLGVLLLAAGVAEGTWAATATSPAPVLRRLSPDQYRHIIDDVFGTGIAVGNRFEPDVRVGGLLELGLAQTTITASGFERYDSAARVIAAQVLSERERDVLVPCKPQNAAAADVACAQTFVLSVGRLLYRRPLTEGEGSVLLRLANETAVARKNFYEGLEQVLATMLVSPQFLFRIETTNRKGSELDGFSKASRLSFFLWNSTPDDVLLDAAARGELNTADGLGRQVDRMLASPRLETGVRAFFADMLGFSDFTTLSKDANIYPKFTPKAVRDAQEQTLRTIVDLLLGQDGDYRDLFTTRKTFLTQTLGTIYGVSIPDSRANGATEQWVPHEYTAGDVRAGLLSQASFVSLHSHPGKSSPTLRGKALREIFLCQKVPDPPGNVDFTLINKLSDEGFKTARERLQAHASEPMCAGCHKITDPIGLSLESFDSSGAFRLSENGQTIDTSGDLNGRKFTNAAELGAVLRNDAGVPGCLANRIYAYGLGRPTGPADTVDIKTFEQGFAQDGYRMRSLMRALATSPAFYRVGTTK